MRIRIRLQTDEPLSLPRHYGQTLQGFIYAQLDPHLADWLHGEAYRYGKRRYKLFTFSRLRGTYQHRGNELFYEGEVNFALAAHDAELLRSLAEHLLHYPNQHLGKQLCTVTGVELLPPHTPGVKQPVRVRTLSPITVYSTFVSDAGRKRSYYYEPFEAAWERLLIENLLRKARSLGWEQCHEAALAQASIRPYRVAARNRHRVEYKGGFVYAWSGLYQLELPDPYFDLAYNTGLGSKNAQGHGMIEVL